MIYNYDLSILRWLNGFALLDQRLDSLVIFTAVFLGYWMIAGVFLFGLFSFFPVFPRARAAWWKNWEMIFVALTAGLIARFGIAEIIRFFWDRSRPFEALSDVRQLVFRDGGSSFPSGHAVFYFAIAAVATRYYPKSGILFYCAALLLSLSRVVAGAHWPSDIIAGALIGIVTGLIAASIVKRFSNQRTVV